MVLKKEDLAVELAERIGWYKKDTKLLLDELENVIFDTLSDAALDEDMEVQLATGLYIGSRRAPAREAKDPRNQKDIIVSEKNLPYVNFTKTFKDKINN